jgi:dolichol-phosphate mannosyltransferase
VQLSIIIPTYNERDNVEPIVQRISSSIESVTDDFEIWFIDDSTDETPAVLEHVALQNQQVHYLHRTSSTGLASAVTLGFRVASGKYMIVMDGDLQHPPELIPVIYQRLVSGIDIVIPSRFVAGGSDGGLNIFRKFVSWTARMIGQMALRKLRKISDCTGGYFGLHRSVVKDADLNPIGWKILIEVLVKGKYKTVHEVPYSFQSRDAGLSKMSFSEQKNYIFHILKLILHSDEDRRFFAFCLVGLSGVIVNIILLSVFVYLFAMREVPASILASVIAMVNNYIWNNRITWRDRLVQKNRTAFRLPLFFIISAIGIAITTLVMDGLLKLGVPVLPGQGAGIIIATWWSYTANNRWTWASAENKARQNQTIVVTREQGRLEHEIENSFK